MKLKILQSFKFAHDGIRVEEFEAGTEVDLTEECAAVALAEGWATDGSEKAAKPPANKARKGAPENK